MDETVLFFKLPSEARVTARDQLTLYEILKMRGLGWYIALLCGLP
jgi:hypothetical protein